MNQLSNHKLLFETISGSKLYGTDSEKSDTDIKGVFFLTLQNVFLEKLQKLFLNLLERNMRKIQKKIRIKLIILCNIFLN